MSRVLPFRGLIPTIDLVRDVACPPYDVIDSDQARDYAQNNPHTFLSVIKPEIGLDPSIDPYDQSVYEQGRKALLDLINKGVLVQGEKPCYYIYKQIMRTHQQTGLVACANVGEYVQQKIKKHEHTQPEKVHDRVRLMRTLRAQTGPVFLTYKASTDTSLALQLCLEKAPIFDFESENGVRHIFYIVDDRASITRIQNAFDDIEYLYIADGHHRSEAAAAYCEEKRAQGPFTGSEEFNSFLTVIFPHNQMKILPYNRLVQNFNGLSHEEFLQKVELNFVVKRSSEKFYQPAEPHVFGLYSGGGWYEFKLKEELFSDISDPVESLDVAILQKYLFNPVLNVIDQRTDKRMKFIGGFDSVEKLKNGVDQGDYACAFSLYATSMVQIMRVADAGNVMPPKSTWFEPKLLSGLVTHLL